MRSSVGERGGFLSGGQRQRIALTQAFLKDSPILILDEFSSALDVQNEAEIHRAIEEMTADRIVFLISHKPELIQTADRILFLNGGRIEQAGTYQELMENEHFRELLGKER
ncbi:ATP-binding cassette domain-containing protein, partial [Bacillus licheniformis]